jgi:hypothetical protein
MIKLKLLGKPQPEGPEVIILLKHRIHLYSKYKPVL